MFLDLAVLPNVKQYACVMVHAASSWELLQVSNKRALLLKHATKLTNLKFVGQITIIVVVVLQTMKPVFYLYQAVI